jgi:excinuclease ABC subunit C
VSTTPRKPPRLAEQRKSLPDGPGVYLFRDAKGKVIYVGKAKSIKKRVASHFSNPVTRGSVEMADVIAQIEFLLVSSETEALLAEQNFIKQYKPRFNIRLRDDKSYPFIAISMDEEFPRVYFTRERHRRDRLYFGPYSSAKRVRSTLEMLGKVFLYRSCQAPEPGPALGLAVPGLLHQALRGALRGLRDPGGVPRVDRRGRRVPERPLQGDRAHLDAKMRAAAAEQDFEQAALERNRLQAVQHLLQRQRIANEATGTLDAIAVAVEGVDANAQVFQIRDGVLADRQSFYLENVQEDGIGEVATEFLLQYYTGAGGIPGQVIVQAEVPSTRSSRRR